MGSANAAAILNVPRLGSLIPGWAGDVVVFDKQYNVLLTVIAGDIKKNIL
jgi:N-acetylglucosamine-6-phosphate deacetylase